jgi:hypothetical protein
MTDQELLDHFAGCALAGHVALWGDVESPSASCESAYNYAAAMMAERKKQMEVNHERE